VVYDGLGLKGKYSERETKKKEKMCNFLAIAFERQ